MALSRYPLVVAVALFLLLAGCFASSSATATHFSSRSHKRESSKTTIWDLLQWYGLPRGIIPDAPVLYYKFDDRTGHLEVALQRPCEVRYEHSLHYEPIIRGTLTFGSITDIRGIHIVHHGTDDVHAIQASFGRGIVTLKLQYKTIDYPDSYFKEIRTCNGAISSLRNAFLEQLI